MRDDEKWLDNLISTLDGRTAATEAEVEEMLSNGFTPFEEFIGGVSRELSKDDQSQQE